MDTPHEIETEAERLLGYTVEIVLATLASGKSLPEATQFIEGVHGTLKHLVNGHAAAKPAAKAKALAQPPVLELTAKAATPIVDPKKSVSHDHLICLECGRKMMQLRGHLRQMHGLDVMQYREKYNLPDDYPIVSPRYHKQCSDRAKSRGTDHMRAMRAQRTDIAPGKTREALMHANG